MAMQQVGQWQRFERAIENAKPYVDHYAAVGLTVRYGRPDGSTVDAWGFYDGEGTWRIRHMPDLVGTWTYDARFTDGTPGASGTFVCVPSDVPGMISRDETNSMWFGYASGAHLLMRSLHVGDRFFAANFPDEARTAFLDWAQKQGYNTISVASHYLNRREAGRGAGWDTPSLWPLDAAEYHKVERILDDLAARQIVIFPFAGFFGRASNYPAGHADQALYVRYALARFAPYWNVMLNVSGPEPLLPREKQIMPREEVVRLGKLIERQNVYDHLLSVHNRTGDDAFIGEPWTTYGVLQGPKTVDLGELSRKLLANHHPSKPLYAQETLWSGNQHGHPDYTDVELRQNAYVILMSAAALNFSDNGGPRREDIGNSSSGFSGSLDLADRRQWRHDILKGVWDFFQTVPFYRMRPRQDLVSAGYCLAEEGVSYLVYLPAGGAVCVAVPVADGPYAATWVNARDTSDRRAGGKTRDGQGLTAPAGEEGEDWLLCLARD
jgi:hypothetical protein